MNPGDIVLLPLPVVGTSGIKVRPTVFLCHLPGPYQTILVCGISTQLHTIRQDWDELIQPGDVDFSSSGLTTASVIRLSYLRAAVPGDIISVIGRIDPARLDRLRIHLADCVRP